MDLIKFVYGVFPVFISYTNEDIRDGAGAICKNYGWYVLIKIRPKYIHDTGILEHELEHAKQIWRWLPFLNLVHPILYRFSSTYRLYSEIKAYGAQLRNNVYTNLTFSYIDKYVNFIYGSYDIDKSITLSEVKKELEKEL